ncbi:MAG: DsbA family protein [Tagaea sp.]|nr:DsbA family protein [Tagaea sp.]
MNLKQISILVAVLAVFGVGAGVYFTQTPKPTATPGAPATASAPAGTARAVPQTPIPGPRLEGLDFVMGHPDAPVTLIEYASLTCPHCQRLHVDVMPRLKAEYIDTGRVRLVFRDFPLDRMALNAHMLARCAGPERFFAYLDVFFGQLQSWTSGSPEQMTQSLRRLARLGGMSDAQMDQCLADPSVQAAVLNQTMIGEREHRVQATPTLVVNGTVHRGGMSFDELDRVLRPLAGPR